MSYCRWFTASIYLFLASEGIECCSCTITPKRFIVRQKLASIHWLTLIFKKKRRPLKRIWLVEQIRPTRYGKLVHRQAIFRSRSAALAHVLVHRDRGDYVPQYVDEQLLEEIRDIEDVVRPLMRFRSKIEKKRRKPT